MSDTSAQDNFSQFEQKGFDSGGDEHETHTTALVVLVLLTAVLVVGIMSATRSDNPADNTQRQSSGPQTISRQVDTEERSDQSGFPDDLPIPDNAEIQQNYSAELGDTGNQRVLIYDTQDNFSDVFSAYQTWLENSSFSITDTTENNDSGFIRASNGNNNMLIVAVSSVNGNRRVQVNYVSR